MDHSHTEVFVFRPQAVAGEQVLLRSSGRQLRDFTSVHDVARTTERFLLRDQRLWAPELYNLGSGQSLIMREHASCIAVVGGNRGGAQASPVLTPPAGHEPVIPCAIDETRLRDTGVTWTNDFNGEVDRALSLCERWFR